jgi:phosphate transport system ATP-binding protein
MDNAVSEQRVEPETHVAIKSKNLSIHYGDVHAIDDVSLTILHHKVTAIIGPSGCGKSTVLRSFNRMNELYPNVVTTGEVLYEGINIYDPEIDPVEVRRRIGMVFQKPNPFPRSIYDNIAWGIRRTSRQSSNGNMDDQVENVLKQVALWDEVADKLDQSALALSGGQQQRLCIARAVALNPDIILMDEPASALDPIATYRIEELIRQLVKDVTIIIVTHNMQQAARVSDYTAFMITDETRIGRLGEYDETTTIFTNPSNKATEDYISGRFG